MFPTRVRRPQLEDDVEEESIDVWLRDSRQLLNYLYGSLKRISHVVSRDFILHPYHDPSNPLRGIEASLAHITSMEKAGLTIEMNSVITDGKMGAVLGILEVPERDMSCRLATSFVGVWRFGPDGRPAEYWEYVAADPRVIKNFQDQLLEIEEFLREEEKRLRKKVVEEMPSLSNGGG